MVRTNNEDCFRIVEPLQLFVLSDGMGGEAHGEVASALAVETVIKQCMAADEDPTASSAGEAQPNLNEKSRQLSRAVHLANQKIFQSSQEHRELLGMGATVTAAWIDSDSSQLSIAHVGDSRLYLLRTGQLQQLTNDHSLVAEQVRRGLISPAEAEQSNLQSVLLRALGTQPEVEVDVEQVALFPGDVLLLCSDGLTRMVTEPEIAGTLQAEPDPQRATAKLIEHANESGGVDNVTVIVVALKSANQGWFSWMRRGARHSKGGNSSAGGR
jgi:PPM family protein phosphatase